MFTVDEPTAEAIRRAVKDGGELAGVVELRRHFPLIVDDANTRRCVRVIAGRMPSDPTGTTGKDDAPKPFAAHRRDRPRAPQDGPPS